MVFQLARGAPCLPRPFFVDDVLFFSTVDVQSCAAIKGVLSTFCSMLGQQISQTKSGVWFSENTPPSLKANISNSLAFLEVISLEKYLGFPIDLSPARTKSFDFLIDKVKAKLDG